MSAVHHMENILFISMGGIGNLILLTPAITIFNSAFPGARLHFLLPRNGSRAIVEKHPRIGRIIEIESSLGSLFHHIKELTSCKPDLVFAATGTNSLKCGAVGLLCGARMRVGEAFGAGKYLYNISIPYEPKHHECTGNIILTRAVVPEAATPDPKVWVTEADKTAAQQFLAAHHLDGCWIGLHLGSGPAMRYKRWPEERFIMVAKRIIDNFNCRVVIFGGPEEGSLAAQAARKIGPRALTAAGRLTIRQSYEVMKNAALFITNDTGPMHLAATAGAPVIAVFGPTMENKTSPLGHKSTIITAPIACRPCYRYKEITCTTFACLEAVDTERVYQESEKVLCPTVCS